MLVHVHNIVFQECTPSIIKIVNIILGEWEAAQHFKIIIQDYIYGFKQGIVWYETCALDCEVNIWFNMKEIKISIHNSVYQECTPSSKYKDTKRFLFFG